jgi:hypothetical protein
MDTFKKLLQRFDSALQKYNPKNYVKLQPPLPKNEVEIFLKRLRISHPDVQALYEWKNGVDISSGLDNGDKIFVFGILFPLASVVNSAENYPHEKPTFIKLIGDAAGDALLFNNEHGDDYGKIHVYSVSLLSIDEPYSYYDSVYSMLETTTIGYETGVLKYDSKEDYLDVDNGRCRNMSSKLNPKSNWWTLESW